MDLPGRFFAPKPEFDLIGDLVGPEALRRDGLGPGDDACLIPQAEGGFLAVSTDASVEDVHYRLDWCSLAAAVNKAVLGNLSDINAMGGTTSHLFLSLGLRPLWGREKIQEIGGELRRLASRLGFTLAGGDTVRTQGPSFFAISVMGKVAGRPLLRSAVKPGHRLFVSGPLGHSAAGLDCLRTGKPPESPLFDGSDGTSGFDSGHAATFTSALASPMDNAIAAHLAPRPPLRLGPALSALSAARNKPVAAIDISDGLSSELWHLSRQSACRLVVDWGKLPYDSRITEILGKGLGRNRILHGGEEYQLLFSGDFSDQDLLSLRAIAPCHAIGHAEPGEGVNLVEADGTVTPLLPGGYSH